MLGGTDFFYFVFVSGRVLVLTYPLFSFFFLPLVFLSYFGVL